MEARSKATKYEQITSTALSTDEEVFKSLQVNGRYVTPWGGQRPSIFSAIRWGMFERSERGLGRKLRNFFRINTEELDRNLPVLPIDESILLSPSPESIQITWLGHATVLVQLDGLNILTDPCLNSFCGPTKLLSKSRFRPAPCSVEELPVIHAICISHNHHDHLDRTTVIQLNKRFGDSLCWYVPMGLKTCITNYGCTNVVELDWWEEKVHEIDHNDSTGVKFIFTPNQHWSRRGLLDENKSLWGSWCVIGSKQKFFFAGDTGYYEDVFKQIGRKHGPFDLSAIPIGAYKPRWFLKFQHVNPSEAVQIHQDVGSVKSVGIHWGTFPLGYEYYMAPPEDLKAALQEKGLDETSFITLNHGETKVITAPTPPEE